LSALLLTTAVLHLVFLNLLLHDLVVVLRGSMF